MTNREGGFPRSSAGRREEGKWADLRTPKRKRQIQEAITPLAGSGWAGRRRALRTLRNGGVTKGLVLGLGKLGLSLVGGWVRGEAKEEEKGNWTVEGIIISLKRRVGRGHGHPSQEEEDELL